MLNRTGDNESHRNMLLNTTINKDSLKIGFIGLGYAGFPMTCLFSRHYDVVGFDVSQSRIDELNRGFDRCGDVSREEIEQMLARGARLTTDVEELRSCNFYVVVVPTPVDKHCAPDTSFIKAASLEVGNVLDRGDVVVFESTVYPGATEEICIPLIEEVSGLRCNEDFFVGYSPERINPGDKLHTPSNVVKVTSGSTPEAARFIDAVYRSILGEGKTWQASSIRVAEASKVIENTQRDINIAFMNEIAQILSALDIDTNEVIEAMNTKWNALGFRPGLVGGHCIGVDPYYLIERASTKGIAANLMTTARTINNSMPGFVTEKVVRLIKERGSVDIAKSRILLLGFTFKENCPDIRNTRVFDIYELMHTYTPNITIFDPWADAALVKRSYGLKICTRQEQLEGRFDAIVVCVAHNEFKEFNFERYEKPVCVIYDVKGLFFKMKEIEKHPVVKAAPEAHPDHGHSRHNESSEHEHRLV